MNFHLFLRIAGFTFLFLCLTALTQIGGLVLLCWLPVRAFLQKKMTPGPLRKAAALLIFVTLYLAATFVLVPVLARPFGRVPLPVTGTARIGPLTVWTCLLNRHYVRPALKRTLEAAAGQMHEAFPGTRIAYLDANFPFFNRFPLFPHLSHNDGKKLDLSFLYRDAETGERLQGESPSPIGYGVYEGPAAGETDMPMTCVNRGYWQYGFLQYLVPQGKKAAVTFDGERTKTFIALLVSQPPIGKLFIEPHLKARLRLHSAKIRFHGCQAVRHDDHIHVQLK